MNKSISKAFFSYVIPSVLAFALSGVYTIVDGFFIGQSLGDMGLTAITLAYPVSALIGAIGTGLGLAGAIRFTILSAQGEEEQTRECFSGTTLLILLAGVLLTALLFLAYVRITTAYFYAAEKTALSYLLVYAEPVCTLLLLLALPPVLGLNGVWLAVPLAQTVTFVIALIAKAKVD